MNIYQQERNDDNDDKSARQALDCEKTHNAIAIPHVRTHLLMSKGREL